MIHFYDGQIRRYITQTIRALSNFTVKYSDGTLVRIPVMYGDADRQVASILRQNSENAVNSTPRIAVYVSGLTMDRARLADATHIGKLHIRERAYDAQNNEYLNTQGKNYTVERLMPTPFTLTMKCDIWSANTDQKLQILEQLLVLFNPSLELQTSDNYVDWTSLTVLELKDIVWDSRQVPQGADSNISIATMNLETPIWLSPPVKVKHLGVITNVITSIFGATDTAWTGVDSYGNDLSGGTTTMSDMLTRDYVTIGNFGIQVYNGQVHLLEPGEPVVPAAPTLEISERQGAPINWAVLFDQYKGQFIDGSSKIYLIQPDGSEVSGTVAVNPIDSTILTVNWDPMTYPSDKGIDSQGNIESIDLQYTSGTSVRSSSNRGDGTFDAIIDPGTIYPGNGLIPEVGDRFLIIEDIIPTSENSIPNPWNNITASANDIIEYDGETWTVIFDAAQNTSHMLWQTNIYKSSPNFRVQFRWTGIAWVKSFEGEYRAGQWRIEL
jgi:hypothetical protein